MTTGHRWAATVARTLLGGVFLYAGGMKLRDPQAFADTIYSYDLLHRNLINLLAAGLPLIELVLGAMLLCGVARRVSAALTVLLYAIFILAISQALIRGLKIDCGCFGETKASAGAAFTTILRDIALLAAAAFVFRAAGFRASNYEVEQDNDP